jgi:hypothetical protein
MLDRFVDGSSMAGEDQESSEEGATVVLDTEGALLGE